MKVALVTLHFPVVSETFVLNLARGILDAGHDCDILSFRGPDPGGQAAPVHPIVDQYGLRARHRGPGVPERRLARVLGAPGALLRVLATEGSRAWRSAPPLNWRGRAWSLRLLYESAAWPMATYDVVHCQFAHLAGWLLDHRELGTLRGRLVVHLRGRDITAERRQAAQAAYRRIFAGADRFVANSEHFKRAAVAAGCPADKIDVIFSGIDLARFPFRVCTPTSGEPLRVAAVGRLVEKKGFDVLLLALAVAAGRGLAVELDLVGDGPLRAALEARAEQLRLARQVRFHGARSSADVARILAASHVFVAPSVTAADGDQDAPTNTVKEAMATGLPVIATQHGGFPEIVEEGRTGWLVPERDAPAIAERLLWLAAAPDCWVPVVTAARARVAATAANEVVNAKVLALYEDLVGPRRAGGGAIPDTSSERPALGRAPTGSRRSCNPCPRRDG